MSCKIFPLILLLCLLVPTQIWAQQAPGNPAASAVQGHRSTIPDHAAMRAFDGIPWEAPSSKFPAGTLMIAHSHRQGPRLIEWDLSRAAVVRSVPLGVASPRDVRTEAQGSGLVVVASLRSQPVQWFSVSSSLQVEHQATLGSGLGAVVAANRQASFVAWLSTSGKSIEVARLNAGQNKVSARRSVPLPEPLSRVEGEEACGILLHGERLLLAVNGYKISSLLSLSLDLQDLARTDRPGPSGTLFAQPGGPALAIPQGATLALIPLDTMLQPRGAPTQQKVLREGPMRAVFDPKLGLALSDGQVIAPDGQERRAMIPPIPDIYRIFWSHGRVVMLGSDANGSGAYVLWAD
jgi:hypothetical protein